jgi:hypothetical protein
MSMVARYVKIRIHRSLGGEREMLKRGLDDNKAACESEQGLEEGRGVSGRPVYADI